MNIPLKLKRLSYILKCAVILSALIGVLLSAGAGRRVFMGGSRVFMYFTIQSNIAIALLCLVGVILMAGPGRIKNGWYIAKFTGTIAITLTGGVFCFVLAPVLGKNAWNVQNILTHVVVPIAAIADFFVTGPFSNIRKRHIFFVILPPLAYVIYAGIGYAAGCEFGPGVRYPYFFLNWGSPAGAFGFTEGLPYMGCAWWILLLLILLFAAGLLCLAVLDAIKRAMAGTAGKKELST